MPTRWWWVVSCAYGYWVTGYGRSVAEERKAVNAANSVPWLPVEQAVCEWAVVYEAGCKAGVYRQGTLHADAQR